MYLSCFVYTTRDPNYTVAHIKRIKQAFTGHITTSLFFALDILVLLFENLKFYLSIHIATQTIFQRQTCHEPVEELSKITYSSGSSEDSSEDGQEWEHDYTSQDSDRESVHSIDNHPPYLEQKFLVIESCLLQLFSICTVCLGFCDDVKKVNSGTLLQIQATCINGHVRQWYIP